jgi:hypothetical protein
MNRLVENNALAAELLAQDAIFFLQVSDQVLLLAVDEA